VLEDRVEFICWQTQWGIYNIPHKGRTWRLKSWSRFQWLGLFLEWTYMRLDRSWIGGKPLIVWQLYMRL
jgi:hypothetical protein